ncbi:MAG TPA: hypothetical protein VF463_08635 [Sphingobium sp.]
MAGHSETGMAPTRFGRDAVRDPRIVLDMRNGREPTQRMCRRLTHFISTHAERAQGRENRQPVGQQSRPQRQGTGVQA